MKTAGIVAEYNPFHNGHAWQLARAREILGDDCFFVIVMSGSFTQRGEPALLDKWDRARAALACGASLVLELPHVFATASAERFAAGGVQTLAATGVVRTLIFGSECGQIEVLARVADYLSQETNTYKANLKSGLDQGLSFPAARQLAVAADLGTETAALLTKSNNILAVEYLKEVNRLSGHHRFECITIQRFGQDYSDFDFDNRTEPASAGAIRQAVAELADGYKAGPGRNPADLSAQILHLSRQMPSASLAILMNALHSRRGLALPEAFALPVLTMLRSLPPDILAAFAGMQEGLAARLAESARRPLPSGDDGHDANHRLAMLLDQSDTRRFPRTRIQRALLAMLMHVRQNDEACMQEPPQYLRVLAFDKNGRHLLKLMRRYAKLPIVTRASDFLEFRRDSIAYRQAEKDLLATDLRSLATGGGSGMDFDMEVLIR